MSARGKKYQAIKEKAPAETVDVAAAIDFLKKNSQAKFDETIEIHMNLGINHIKTDQMVRGSVVWPSGATRQKTVAVLTDDKNQQKEAKAAGAALAGGEDLIDDISEKGALEADIVVATPAMMPKVAKVAKILGPKGLMPNPKTGTVAQDPASAVKELLGGKASFKMDQLGNIHEAVGKVSWDDQKIIDNIEAIIEAVRQARPGTQKGEYLKSVALATTMSPAVKVSV